MLRRDIAVPDRKMILLWVENFRNHRFYDNQGVSFFKI